MGAAEALGGSISNELEDAVRIFVEFVVPDAKDDPAFISEIAVSDAICL